MFNGTTANSSAHYCSATASLLGLITSAGQGLQQTPGPKDFLASAGQGPPAYSQAPGLYPILAKAGRGPPAYSQDPGPPG